MHLVGDVHQPLHASWGDDKGGNKFQVRWDGRGTNLHHVCDAGLIESIDTDAGSFANSLRSPALKHPYPESDNPAVWSEESCRIVSDDGFYPGSRKLGMMYLLEWRPTLDDRLEIAGQRLAALLNVVLGR